ncbi:MAG: hypothetical protein AABO41_09060 [Acidobacteriota bacterium]
MLYSGTLLGIITAAFVLGDYHGTTNQLLAMAGGSVLMWTLGKLHQATARRGEFANITAGLGLSLLAATAYIWSFQDLWHPVRLDLIRSSVAILFLALSVTGSFFLLRRERQTQQWPTIGVLAVGAMLCGSALLASARIDNMEVLFIIVTNLAALVVAAVIIGMSLTDERRSVFWLGSLYLVLLVLSRFLEYETSLLVKSAAFLACGAAVILAGIRYEQYLRRKDPRTTGDKEKEIVHE